MPSVDIAMTLVVDEHAKLKTQLKTKQSSQPRATSNDVDNVPLIGAGKTIPRESRVTWGPTQVTWIPDESHVRGIPRPARERSV